MTSKRIVFSVPPLPFCPSGVAVVTPGLPRTKDESEGAWLARNHAATIAKWVRDGLLPPCECPMTVMEAADIPNKSEPYRNAWVFDGKSFGHDMAKARELHRDKIRRERKPLLEAADIALMRAIETGADTKAIAAEKQRLRDAPANPAIDAAKTIEDLKRITL